jgi:hypothetical protein
VTLSGLPQLVLAVEDGIPKSGSEELRSIRSMLFGDRAATSKSAPAVPVAVPLEASQARPILEGVEPAVPSFVRCAAPPGQRALLGPSKLALRRLRALGLGASGFV